MVPMARKDFEKKRMIIVLLVMVLLVVVADIAIRLLPPAKQQSRCLAVPTKFIMEYPDCANRLLEAMNITNVKVITTNVPPDSLCLQGNRQ
jgi:hypothetical protein